jgi:diaminopimelate decarboxylase
MNEKEKIEQFEFQETQKINEEGHLEIAGVDTIDLANKYGTPLLIYDVATIRKNIRAFKEALKTYKHQAKISYASKAFASVAMYQVIQQEDIAIDVVSGGELYIAKQAGFPAERINFHGNNKSKQELEDALDYGIGHFIVDNFHELQLLTELTNARQQTATVIIRVTPGVDADTHKYIMTGHKDSKFGFDLESGQAKKAVKQALNASYLKLDGLHMHVGSQIFGTDTYVLAIKQILNYVKDWQADFDFELKVFNIGGGFGIQHTPDEEEFQGKQQLEIITEELMTLLDDYELPLPELWIEPGRSIVGEAGTTIYDIGSQKVLPDVRHYVAVDGGMADNIRPAFYDAEYFGKLANRMHDEATTEVSIAGKACESGDMLIWDLPLPKVEAGDKLAVFNTGDYTFVMASNYNRLTRPAVVFVEDGKDFLAIRRETPEDFMRFEHHLPEDF